MFKALRDPAFLRLFLGATLVLGALAFLAFELAWPTVTAAELSGTYERAGVPFLHVDALPQKMVIEEDGPIALYASDGSLLFKGPWTWDARERIIRLDNARWDRRIRSRSTLFGTRLSMRVSDLPLDIDHHEHDEEVDLKRTDP